MRPNTVKQKIADGGCVLNGWLSSPNSYGAEVVGHSGFDSVTVDMQHGMIGFDAAMPMLQALSATPAMPIVRVPSLNGPQIMQALDAGAYGIICPMISTEDDARAFVSACRYPPHGERSFGPTRGLLYGGADYFAKANDTILTLAMIETQQGLDNLDAILAVEGLDGVFIGPNDLCLALGLAPSSEPADPKGRDTIEDLRARISAAGKISGIFCSGPAAAAARKAQGFDMVTPGNDTGWLRGWAQAALAEMGETTGGTANRSGY